MSRQVLAMAPDAGASPLARRLAAQARLELALLLRNGEQLLLVLVIPTLLLAFFSSVPVVDTGTERRVDFLAPGILALAVISTAFTGQAIATGFERRYGALKWLGSTPLPRSGLVAAKTLAVLAVEVLQVVVLVGVALVLGWDPEGSPLAATALLLAGTAAFSVLGLLMAGTLRAEATLAAANLVYLLLLLSGGILVPLDRFPDALRVVAEATPAAALAGGLREVLSDGSGIPWPALGVLAGWALAGSVAAARFFRWE